MLTPQYLINERFDDRYFDVVNALDEAQQIYFRNNRLMERLIARIAEGKPLVIGETGFGAGRLVVSLMEFLNNSALKNAHVEYYSVELYPMCAGRMKDILDGFKDRVGQEIDALVEAYRNMDISTPGWHTMHIRQPFGTVTIKLWIGEALEMVKGLEKSCEVWFLDGHGPKKNPSIWRPELMAEIGKKTITGGTCATYTVASSVIKALMAAGFTLEKLPGCGGKKLVLHGIKCELAF